MEKKPWPPPAPDECRTGERIRCVADGVRSLSGAGFGSRFAAADQSGGEQSCLITGDASNYERGVLAKQQFPADFSIGFLYGCFFPSGCPLGRADAGSGVLWHQCGTFGFLSFHHFERECRMDKLRRGDDINPGKFLASAVGSLTAALNRWTGGGINTRIARAQQERSGAWFSANVAQCRREVNDALIAYQTSQGKKNLAG